MRLAARMRYSGENHDLEIREMDPKPFAKLQESKPDLTGVPVYWCRVNGKLQFWPTRNVAYCSIVNLDTGSVLLEKGAE